MGHTDMGTDVRVFYIALLSLQPRRQNNLKEIVGRGDEAGVRVVFYEMLCHYNANGIETRHSQKHSSLYFLGCKLCRYSLGDIPRCFEQ